MSITTLQAIQYANATLTLAVNSLAAHQRIMGVIAQAQAEGRDISSTEWDAIEEQADAADERLAAEIRKARGAP